MKKLLLGVILPVGLLVVGVGVFLGMRAPEPARKPPLGSERGALLTRMPAAEVQVVRGLTDLSETLDITVNGSVVPYREIELAAEVGGKIIEKDPSVRSGNLVKKGQVLFQVDPRDYELEIERLQRRREQELASLEELEQNIKNTERLVAVAEEDVALAEKEVKRFQDLGSSFASRAELDQAKRTLLTSMNQKVSLENQLQSYRTSKNRLELAAKLAETELEQANLNFDRTTIVAPVDGRIVSEQVEKDSYVQRGTPLLTIEDTEKVEIACNLRMDQLYWILDQRNVSADSLVNAALASGYELPKIPVDVVFELSGRESTEYKWRGTLDRYDGAGLDPQSRTVPVRVLVENPSQFLVNGRPADERALSGPPTLVRGMFVQAVIKAKPATRLLLVPKLAVKPATSSNRVWKFSQDEQAYEAIAKRFQDEIQSGSDSSVGFSPANDEGGNGRTAKALVPSEWDVGFLDILEGIQVVGAYEHKAGSEVTDYLICEVASSELAAGDQVVVSPLPGVEPGVREAIRVSIAVASASAERQESDGAEVQELDQGDQSKADL